MKATDVEKILSVRYSAPEYAFLPQVRNQTGYIKQVRTADALAMSLFPSRGLHLYGFEIKISRSDWLSELASPEKAEDFYKYCDFWYLVVSDPAIVKEGELPVPWGLIETSKGKCRIVKTAPHNLETLPPSLLMLCGLLRKASELRAIADTSLIEAARLEGYTRGTEAEKYQTRSATAELTRLRDNIAKFEEVSGLKLDSWDAGNVAEAVKQLRSGVKATNLLRRLKAETESVLATISKSLGEPVDPKNRPAIPFDIKNGQ